MSTTARPAPNLAAAPALSRTEARLLTLAAARSDARLVMPPHLKPVTTQRLLAKLLKQGLIIALKTEGDVLHILTPAGYAAIGLTPPAPPAPPAPPTPVPTVADASALPTDDAAPAKAVSKRELILGLLHRAEGATLPELIAATGWLPHTTRAALSRLRSAGQVLAKSPRQDGITAYRILLEVPAPRRRGRSGTTRGKPAETKAAAA